MLQQGQVDIAFIQNDNAYYAVNGTEMFKDKKVTNLYGLATLYPETIQIVTLADTGITDLSQVKGKRVAVVRHRSKRTPDSCSIWRYLR